ncbi:MAG TPA: hypothetical protein PLB48_12230 [Treponema sp.]|nr:hypothetical protein [Treponema sp.]
MFRNCSYNIFFIVIFSLAIVVLGTVLAIPLFSMAGETKNNKPTIATTSKNNNVGQNVPKDYQQALQNMAEEERLGGFKPGMGLAESSIREQAGDLAGAVFAAFKDLFFAYQYGYLSKSQVDERLAEVGKQFPEQKAVHAALGACRALISGDAEEGLAQLGMIDFASPAASYGLDDFPRWMERVFVLQNAGKTAEKNVGSAVWDEYLATRSRYINYPLYWLVLSRNSRGAQQMDGAERCVSLAPKGPYADAGRALLAQLTGLSTGDSAAIKTRLEIESVIETAVASGSGEDLNELLPLLALPDNPYTLYALGACRGLAAQENFAHYFQDKMKKSSGRLNERLRYILGGRS